MKKDVRISPNSPTTDFQFALKTLQMNLRMAESEFAFELAMVELDRLIEMAELMEWP